MLLFFSESSRNAKSHIVTSTTSGNDDTGHDRSFENDKNETAHRTTSSTTAVLMKDDDMNQQLKYVEKVMVSVHRGASDVKRLVRESTETNEEFNDLHSVPVSKPLQHVRQSSREDNTDRSSRVQVTHEIPGGEEKVVRSMEKNLRNDMTSSEISLIPRRKPSEHSRSGSIDDSCQSKISSTRVMPVENAGIARSSPERNLRKAITKQDTLRTLKMNEGWGEVVEEFLVTNKTETTNTSNNVKKRHGDELFEFIEEQLVLEKTPEDSSTPVQNENIEGRSKSGHNSPNSSFSNTAVTHARSKSLEMVGKTDGTRFGTFADVQGN